jgi:hypothetical protein
LTRYIALAVPLLVAALLALSADAAHAITLEHDGFETRASAEIVLIGANNYGLVNSPRIPSAQAAAKPFDGTVDAADFNH